MNMQCAAEPFRRAGGTTLVIALVLACMAAPEVRAGEETSAALNAKAWPMKYERGVTAYTSKPSRVIEQGKKLQVTVSEETISCADNKGVALEIPVPGVLAVTYDNTSHNRGWRWLKQVSPHAAGGGGMGGAAVGLAVLAVGGALAPFNTKKHFVTVLWKDGRMTNSVVFKVGKGEYRDFLETLQEATGRAWQDFPQVRKKLQADLKREKRHAVEIWLDRYAWVSGTVLGPGRYRIVALEEEANGATLYFFRGRRVNTQKIDGLLPVEIIHETSDIDEPMVILVEGGRHNRIRTIHLPDRTFRSVLYEEKPSPHQLRGDDTGGHHAHRKNLELSRALGSADGLWLGRGHGHVREIRSPGVPPALLCRWRLEHLRGSPSSTRQLSLPGCCTRRCGL
jgi:hypothetical protein